ncbi:MAG: zinc-binding dehydrogenase [Desulfobacterales bacterium]|jgi:alcohol dehydrogenase
MPMNAFSARAAVMHAPRQNLSLQHYPLPDVARDCILVKVTCCTICGSDVHTWTGRRDSAVPIILGHEIVGTIAAKGKAVTHDCADQPLAVGDRISWTLMDSCGKCYYCRQKGLMMKCRHLKKYGHDSCEAPPHFVGGFAEYCYLTPGTCVIKLPESVSDEQAAPANCALATVVAGWEAAAIRPLENVWIQGAGALGIYAAALATHYGCGKIVVSDVLDHRLEFVRSFGATDTLNTRHMTDSDTVAAVRHLTDGLGVDCVLEVAGSPGLIEVGLQSLRIGGRLIEIGNSFPDARFSYDACDLVWRRLTLTGLHNYDTRHLRMGIDFLAAANDQFPFDKLVTHRFELAEINAALQIAASGEAIRVAVLP